MQYPVGMEFNPETMRNEMVDFMAVAFSPVAVVKFFHTVLSSWMLGAAFVIGVSAWYLIRKREKEFALASMKVAAAVGLVRTFFSALTVPEATIIGIALVTEPVATAESMNT